MQRVPAKHRALGRAFAELDARHPLPIDLPSINSIPVVAPLVSPLLDNGASSGAQPSTSPNPQPAATPAAGSGGSSGDNGNSGNSGNSGDSGGSTPSSATSPASGGGTAAPVPVAPTQTSPTSAPGSNPSSSSANDASGVTFSSLSPSGGGNFLGIAGGNSASVSAGPGSPTGIAAALGTSAPGVLATGSMSPSQYSLGSGSNTVAIASSSSTITASAASSREQLSGGAIAGITIVCLIFLLALILLVVRRRSIARRMEIRGQWWFGRHTSGGNPLDNDGSPRSPLGSSGEAPEGRLSARSSFATNFDQGLMLHVDSSQRFSLGILPDLPPQVEVRERNSVFISTGGEVARRESLNSMLSNGSEPDAQYLTVPGQKNQEPTTPMSVRPFTPSESFSFPKPPPSSTVDCFVLSGTQGPTSRRSSTTLVHLATSPPACVTDLSPESVLTPSLHPQTPTPSVVLSPLIAAPNPSPLVDPFADPGTPGFADVEVIRRPFKPSLDDELEVCPGDRVRLLQVFDDGWAFIEKLATTEGGRHQRGLIPVDCLRETNQALPTFLAQKRVSSYASDQPITAAL